MKKLLEGVVRFRTGDFEEHRDLFHDLSGGQTPHTLFIGCADSRVVPNLITGTQPGELFVVRNIANIVPRYRQTEEVVATTSAIEYACLQLEVKDIVVCGHSNCGGCAALYASQDKLAELPHTAKWLEQAYPVRDAVLQELGTDCQDHAKREWLTEQKNIVLQMQNLLSYPFIRERFQAGKLGIHGWHYIIETGEVFSYNREAGWFEPIN